jgi:hypothetical protein
VREDVGEQRQQRRARVERRGRVELRRERARGEGEADLRVRRGALLVLLVAARVGVDVVARRRQPRLRPVQRARPQRVARIEQREQRRARGGRVLRVLECVDELRDRKVEVPKHAAGE